MSGRFETEEIMNIQFADRMKDYEAGIFQVLNEKKNDLIARGRTVYNLSVGTPDFAPQSYVMEAVQKAAGLTENYKYSLLPCPCTKLGKVIFVAEHGVDAHIVCGIVTVVGVRHKNGI